MLLEEFQLKHTVISGKALSLEFISRFERLLPTYLIEIWEKFGLFKTKDSFLSLTNPDDFDFLKENGILPPEDIVFCRTSFGDLFTWKNGSWNHLMSNQGKYWKRGDMLELFFESSMYRDEFLNDVLYQKYHNKAVKKLGLLEPDECFAFVPAFALGGSVRTSEIEKVKLREHLLFLSQLTGKPEFVNLSISSETIDNLIDAYDRENP